ncbi:putative reverse transcriptase domain-containing protein, partial [Tanacetum coccineum]
GHLAKDCRSRPATANNNNRNNNNNNNRNNNNQRAQGANTNAIVCFECGTLGHFRNNCPQWKNKNQGNGNAVARAYAVGVAGQNPDNNVVTAYLPSKGDWRPSQEEATARCTVTSKILPEVFPEDLPVLGHVNDNKGSHLDPARSKSVKDWASQRPNGVQVLGGEKTRSSVPVIEAEVVRSAPSLAYHDGRKAMSLLMLMSRESNGNPPLRVQALVHDYLGLDLPKANLECSVRNQILGGHAECFGYKFRYEYGHIIREKTDKASRTIQNSEDMLRAGVSEFGIGWVGEVQLTGPEIVQERPRKSFKFSNGVQAVVIGKTELC